VPFRDHDAFKSEMSSRRLRKRAALALGSSFFLLG
jgi:hypothetical protein